MIRFIRENMSMISKFMLTHLVMSILGIMVGLDVLSFEVDLCALCIMTTASSLA